MAGELEAVVEFDYKAQEPDELTIKKGDTITDIKKQPGGWWEGTLVRTGKRGMFPDNFVKAVQIGDSKMDVPHRQGGVPRRCRVLFSYQPANDDELELQVGELIDILAEVEEGWWRGKLNSQVGVFPSNFVEEVFDDVPETKEASHRKTSRSSLDSESSKQPNVTANTAAMNHDEAPPAESDVPELPPKPMKELCRVMYPYDAVNDDELTLREGDVITLVSKDCQDMGWWKGELSGRIGVFPDNFVQLITVDESTKPARPPAKSNSATTNRVKDSITRPTAPQTTALRKSIELPPKPDEKTSPPGLSKKPVLPPPPLKKPQRSPSGASINKTHVTTQATVTKPVESPTNGTVAAAKLPLTALTFSLSVKETTKSKTDVTDGGIMSRSTGSFNLETDVDLDCVGRTAMLSHPTASRVRAPRRRPPSGVTVKESGEISPGMVNGTAEHHFTIPEEAAQKAPWVEELKMNQAKKNSAQGRTRVMIGGGGNVDLPTSPSPEPLKVSPGPVTLRGQPVSSSSARPQSMFGGRSFSLSPSSPDSITISHKQWTELNEKVLRLEMKVESQQESFAESLRELTSKLNQETERRVQMEAELAKLANFVTQV